MTQSVRDGIQDLSSNSPVNPFIVKEVGRMNARITSLKRQGMTSRYIRPITYPQMVFMDQYLRTGNPEKSALIANPRIKNKYTARSWGMKQLENDLVQATIRRALEGEDRLSPDKIATKVADAMDNAESVSDVIKVAEFVTKTRGEFNDGNKIGVNIGVGVIGGQSTEELEKQFAILVADDSEQSITGPDETNILDEITIRGGEQTGPPEF